MTRKFGEPPDFFEEDAVQELREALLPGSGPLVWSWTNPGLEPQLACCRRCLWWRSDAPHSIGVCVYHAPKHELFPGVDYDHWCRRFEPGDIAPTY